MPARCWGDVQDVVTVLSSDSPPYLQALEGFQETWGHQVPSFNLWDGRPAVDPGTRVVVTFGGLAAQQRYPKQAIVIYCMAPGAGSLPGDHAGPSITVYMIPPPGTILAKLKDLQPPLHRLAVLWTSPAYEPYIQEMRKAAAALDIQIRSERLADPEGLPDTLRALVGKTDALWLPPDPVLINPVSFSAIKEFSWLNHIPFYAPTDALVEKGATASVSSHFRDIGRAAANAAQQALAGAPLPAHVYPQKAETLVNLTAANHTGLQIPPDVLKKVDKVLP